MNRFGNKPQMRDAAGNIQIPRYSHSPVEIEHYGMNAAIMSDGKIELFETGDVDRFQISASLVFKLEMLLKTLQKQDRTYSPITIEHHGINASIQTHGDVTLSRVVPIKDSNEGDVEIDELELSNSLIFKLSTLLRATRKVTYVTSNSPVTHGIGQDKVSKTEQNG